VRRLLHAVGLAGFALVLSGSALAAGGEEAHGPNWGMLFFHCLNISILFLVIYRFGRRPIQNFLAERSRGIREQIGAGRERLEQAEAEMAQLRQRLDSFEGEAERIVALQIEQGEQESARAAQRAEQTAQRIREDAQNVASQELNLARQELRAEASELATELAAEILRGELSEGDDARLIDDFVGRVGERQ